MTEAQKLEAGFLRSFGIMTMMPEVEMGAPVFQKSTADAANRLMPEPLSESEWAKFWEYLSTPALTAEQHGELAALHAKAQAYIDGWEPDPKVINALMKGMIDSLVVIVHRLVDLVPAAGGLVSYVAAMRAAHESLTVASNGPANIPPMPPPPDEVTMPPPMSEPTSESPPAPRESVTTWPTPEQSAGLEPVGPTAGATGAGVDPNAAPQGPQPDHG